MDRNKSIKATGNSKENQKRFSNVQQVKQVDKLEGIKPTSGKGYKCPECGRFNESSGLCNNGDLQIVCKCGIVYNQRFEVDSLLSNINSLKDKEQLNITKRGKRALEWF